MRIQLKQHEIEAAIKSYVSGRGIAGTGDIGVAFKAGRKGAGISAEVTIGEDGEQPNTLLPKPGTVEKLLAPRVEAATEGKETVTVDAENGVQNVGTEAGVAQDAEAAKQEDPAPQAEAKSLFN